ncbi:MAG: DUF92 domain-containing protein [Candidatus Micrarchaeaceae archaeon]
MDFLTLDWKGVMLALVFGVIFIVLGLMLGYFFLGLMIAFLVLSAIVTYMGWNYKKKRNLGQSSRGFKNVLANGLPPIIMVVIFYLFMISNNSTYALLAAIGFMASVAAITSDKFSSEIGILDGQPTMLLGFRKVKKGTSGAITWLGLVAGLIGSFIIAALVLVVRAPLGTFAGIYGFTIAKAILVIGMAGFIGCLVDSIFGYYEEKGIGNKYTSNFICGIAGALVAILIFMII